MVGQILGYDNCHPDYLPACIEAGGWNALENPSKKLEFTKRSIWFT